MNLEGLQSVLAKEEVVATQTDEALLTRPQEVDEGYKAHVRTYVPLHTGRGESNLSVKEYARRLERQVKDKGAPRGYITADFGYGKTSTALYLWEQAQHANLVAVPPFQLTKLSSLIVATYGWMNYVLGRSRPSLRQEAKEIYDSFANRSVEQMALESGADPSKLRQWLQEGRLDPKLTAPDYIQFFEQMTGVAYQAGFEGLVILADEVQQYIEPEVKAGVKDPIAPLFNIVQGLATRQNHLAFGLILIIPRKELSVIIDQRGDLVDRMRGLSLDLTAIYDQTFPERLWKRLANEFQFAEHAADMVIPETLTSLGQISIRGDLSNGPRTVVNTFRRLARRHLEHPGSGPYTPVDLVNDFLEGEIRFDGVKRLQEVTTRALGHGLVKGHPAREQAVKLAAAFPEEGATRAIQREMGRRLGVDIATAFDELFQSSGGELVIRVGDVANPGFTLLGMERGETKTDWLTLTIREFGRTYYESAESTTERAVEGFLDMLTNNIFRSGQWKVAERLESRLTQNAGLVVEGAFPNTVRQFPERRIHIRVLVEDEQVKDANPMGEVLLEFRLRRYLHLDEETRRSHSKPVEFDYESYIARFTLNLMGRTVRVSRELDQTMGKIVSPFKITPLLLLSFHEILNEKRKKHQIPKDEDQLVEFQFQPLLLDNAQVELLDADIGSDLDAAGPRLVELVTERLLEKRYGDTYSTLMVASNWQSTIKKYINALHHLEALEEKQGQVNVEGRKEEIAKLFTITHTTLDNFMVNYEELLELVRDFPSRREAEKGETGAVRFSLHPLEAQFRIWLQESPHTTAVEGRDKRHILHLMPIGHIYNRATEMGYKADEVDMLLEVMEARGMIERDQRGNIREALRQIPSLDEVENAITELQSNLRYLQTAFPRAREFDRIAEEAEKYIKVVEQLRQETNETTIIKLRRTVRARLGDVEVATEGRRAELLSDAQKTLRRLPPPDKRRRSTLESPLSGVKYNDQVDNLRMRLLKAYTRFNNQVTEIRYTLTKITETLSEEDLALPTLTMQASALRDLEKNVEAIEQQREELDEQYRQFGEWSDLVENGARLFNTLQVLGESGEDLLAQFEQLSREIRGDISASGLSALPRVTTYLTRLNELRGKARQIESRAVETFNTLQNRYRDALTQRINYPRNQLWEPIIYSPLDPQGIYQQLYGNVQSTVRETIRRLRDVQTVRLNSVRSLLHTPQLVGMPPDKLERIETEGRSLEKELHEVEKNLTQINEVAADQGVIRNYAAEGGSAFLELLDDMRTTYQRLDSINTRLRDITQLVITTALTPEERRVWKALEELSDGGRPIDVSDLFLKLNGRSSSAEWQALQNLWEKQRLQIRIIPVRYEHS